MEIEVPFRDAAALILINGSRALMINVWSLASSVYVPVSLPFVVRSTPVTACPSAQ